MGVATGWPESERLTVVISCYRPVRITALNHHVEFLVTCQVPQVDKAPVPHTLAALKFLLIATVACHIVPDMLFLRARNIEK